MTPPRHPLTTLSAEELPGWIAATHWFRDVLRTQNPLVDRTAILSCVEDMRAIAEGLLANTMDSTDQEGEPEPDEAGQHGMADAAAEADGIAEVAIAAIPAPRPAPRIAAEPRATTWSDARNDLLRREWPGPKRQAAILEEVNALPGPPCASIEAMRVQASKLGLRRAPHDAHSAAPHAPQTHPAPGPKPPTGQRALSDLSSAEMADLRKRYIDSAEAVPAIAAAFRLSVSSLYTKASTEGWRRTIAPHRQPATPSPPPMPMPPEDKAEAREQLRTGKLRGARDVIEEYGCTAEEAQEIVDAHRADQRGRAA